jgi:hypothetical protein
MDSCEDKLARLVAKLQKAVIGQELHRGRADRPARRKTRRAH